MRILVFTDTLWPYGGGGELATYLYINLLKKHNMQVRVIMSRNDFSKIWKGLYIYRLGKIGIGKYFIPKLNDFKNLQKLIRWSDIVYFSGIFNMMPLTKYLNKPVVVHLHSYFPICPIGHYYNFYNNNICDQTKTNCYRCIFLYESMKKSLYQSIISMILNYKFNRIFLKNIFSADSIIFVSEAQKNIFQKIGNKLNPNFTKISYVLYNPLPDINWQPIEGDDIGFIGGIDPVKGYINLLRSWLLIYNHNKNINLKIAMFNKKLETFNKINIIGYPRLQGKMFDEFYSSIKTIVVPSLTPETFSYASVEACLKGRLLIASNIGGIPEIVGGLPGVKLITPGKVETLADMIEWAVSIDRYYAMELGLKNRESIIKKLDNEKSVKKMIEIFEKIR